ncbi:MAG: hypothetical protein AAFQ98_05460 [Bacteroidota bacterium]
MKASVFLIRLGGAINLLVGILHITFWSLFDWPVELAKLTVDNSNVVQMLNLFTIVFFFYTSTALLYMPSKLLTTSTGRMFIGMLATLYLARLAMEFYFPSGSIGFGAFLAATVFLFALPLFRNKSLSHAS